MMIFINAYRCTWMYIHTSTHTESERDTLSEKEKEGARARACERERKTHQRMHANTHSLPHTHTHIHTNIHTYAHTHIHISFCSLSGITSFNEHCSLSGIISYYFALPAILLVPAAEQCLQFQKNRQRSCAWHHVLSLPSAATGMIETFSQWCHHGESIWWMKNLPRHRYSCQLHSRACQYHPDEHTHRSVSDRNRHRHSYHIVFLLLHLHLALPLELRHHSLLLLVCQRLLRDKLCG